MHKARLYYFGKYGNAFYGVADYNIDDANIDYTKLIGGGYGVYEDHTWELVDTDSSMNGVKFKSRWGNGSSGETILNYANGLVNTYFSNADKMAMKKTNVNTKNFWSGGYGSIDEAYMWSLGSY